MRPLQKREGAIRLHPSLTNNWFTGESFPNTNRRYKNYVPLDYIGAQIIDFLIHTILNHTELKFTMNYVTKDGEFFQPKNSKGNPIARTETAKFKNLSFTYFVDSGRLMLYGSLHTFYNNGSHNHNDFDSNAFAYVLKELESIFGLLPQHLKIYYLEWGVNIKPPTDTETILNHCIEHKRIKIVPQIKHESANFCTAEHDEYVLKLYDKGLQNGIKNILRIEHRQTDYNKYSKKHCIGRTLQNLINSDFKGMKETLLNDWQNVVFFDPKIDRNSKEFKYASHLFWDNLKKRSGNTYNKHRNKLKLINKRDGANTQNKIIELIKLKLNQMNPIKYSTWLRFPTLCIQGIRNPFTNPLLSTSFINYPILSTHYLNGVFLKVP